jgi:hypothetical protein
MCKSCKRNEYSGFYVWNSLNKSDTFYRGEEKNSERERAQREGEEISPAKHTKASEMGNVPCHTSLSTTGSSVELTNDNNNNPQPNLQEQKATPQQKTGEQEQQQLVTYVPWGMGITTALWTANNEEWGAYVSQVDKNGLMDRAGLQEHDIICEVWVNNYAGVSIRNRDDFMAWDKLFVTMKKTSIHFVSFKVYRWTPETEYIALQIRFQGNV